MLKILNTTNVEFGLYAKDSKVVYGRPENADRMIYLNELFKRFHENDQIFNNLKETCEHAVNILR